MNSLKNLALVAAVLIPTGAALTPLPEYIAHRISYATASARSEAILDRLNEQPASSPASFELVAEAFAPSVVTIYSTVVQSGFGGRAAQGLGSGVIVDANGLILTNNHVVEQARSLRVAFQDGTSLAATLVGRDPRTDLAVIKVEASGLTPARLADSAKVKVGQWVLAFGSPYGLTQSVTHGIVSAVGRAGVGIADYENFIQTDASINRGNSGGPLVNAQGEVIGINTAIFAPSGGNEGIAFSIPINMAKKVMERLLSDGRVVRGFLGISMVEMDADIARQIGYDQKVGILVDSLSRSGPAYLGGVRVGDVIVKVDGDPVGSNRAVQERIADTAPGTAVHLGVWRAGAFKDLEVTVGELPADLQLRATRR